MSIRFQQITGSLLVLLICSAYAERSFFEPDSFDSISDSENRTATANGLNDPLLAPSDSNSKALVVYTTKSLLGRIKKNELSLTVPAASLVKIGSGGIKTSMKKIMDTVAYQVVQTIGTAIGTPGDWVSVAVGTVLFLGAEVSSKVIDFVSWAGVAGAGLSAMDAAGKIATAEHGCEYAIGGLQLMFATASLGLSIASLTCMAGTDGGTIAAFAAGAGDIFWSAIEEPLNNWCNKKKNAQASAASVEVMIPRGGSGGFQTEDQVAAFAAASVRAPEMGCRRGNIPKPEQAEEMYANKIKFSLGELIRGEHERPARCLGDLCSDLAYGSAWSFLESNSTKKDA